MITKEEKRGRIGGRWDIYMKRVLYGGKMKSPLYEEALIWAAIFMGLWEVVYRFKFAVNRFKIEAKPYIVLLSNASQHFQRDNAISAKYLI